MGEETIKFTEVTLVSVTAVRQYVGLLWAENLVAQRKRRRAYWI
jgi:hypothetical protein